MSHPARTRRANGHAGPRPQTRTFNAEPEQPSNDDRASGRPQTELYTHHDHGGSRGHGEFSPETGNVPSPGPWPADDDVHDDMWPADVTTGVSEQGRHPLPEGHWVDDADAGHDLWIPEPVVAASPRATSSSSPVDPAEVVAPPRSREQSNGATSPIDAPLPASRPADHDSRRVRTTVDRPVASLRPIDIDEARQLAECFAIDYMSCDEDDPQLRQLALSPYLARRADAMLGWPADHEGKGRQRAVLARAGECLAQGRWVTVDVSVLVEVYERAGPAPDAPEAPRERLQLPPDARWSAVPPAYAPGWTCSMTVWHRLGIPVRRHDRGHLVVELFTVSEPEE